jgi:hypothetical protein
VGGLTLLDIGGVIGVLMMLFAYAAAQVHRLDPTKVPSLLMNFFGSGLVLASLSQKFNLSAALMEGAWALVALFGLIRAMRARR